MLKGEKYCIHYKEMAGPGVTICVGCQYDATWNQGKPGCQGIIRQWNAISQGGTGTCHKCLQAVEKFGQRERMSSKEYTLAMLPGERPGAAAALKSSSGARSHADPPPKPPGISKADDNHWSDDDSLQLGSQVQWIDTPAQCDTPPQFRRHPHTAFWWGTQNQVEIPHEVTQAMMAGARINCKLKAEEIKSKDEAMGWLSDTLARMEILRDWYRNGTDQEQPWGNSPGCPIVTLVPMGSHAGPLNAPKNALSAPKNARNAPKNARNACWGPIVAGLLRAL